VNACVFIARPTGTADFLVAKTGTDVIVLCSTALQLAGNTSRVYNQPVYVDETALTVKKRILSHSPSFLSIRSMATRRRSITTFPS
jgi:hypothetical protein